MESPPQDSRIQATFAFLIPRAGLHHGWVTPRNGRYFGTTRNLAVRIAAMARGGQVEGGPDYWFCSLRSAELFAAKPDLYAPSA